MRRYVGMSVGEYERLKSIENDLKVVQYLKDAAVEREFSERNRLEKIIADQQSRIGPLINKNARTARHLDDLIAAVEEYESEATNPAPDYVLRRTMRDKMFDTLDRIRKEQEHQR